MAKAQFAASKPRESTSTLECDIPVRNTFIHFDDDLDDDDDELPLFSQHTRSTPVDFHRKRGALPCAEVGNSDLKRWLMGDDTAAEVEAQLVQKAASETAGSSWATHEAGLCMPCAFSILKPGGCWKGSECDRCHFCTKTELHRWKRTIRKSKRRAHGVAESTDPALERQELSEAPDAEAVTPASTDKDDVGSDASSCGYRGPLAVKNAFIHFADDEAPDAEAVTPASTDKDDVGSDDFFRYPGTFAVKNTFIHFSDDEDEGELSVRMCKSDAIPGTRQTGASELDLFRSRLSDFLAESARLDGKNQSSSSGHSSRSTTPGRFRWHGAASSSSDSTEDSNLETRGASFEVHQSGECQPCFYFSSKADGCRKGADCIYCHFCSHEDWRQKKRAAKTLSKQLKRAYEGKCC